MRINAGEDPNQVAEAHGFTNLGQIASLEGYYLFELKEQHRKRDVASEKAKRLAEHPSITWIEEQVSSKVLQMLANQTAAINKTSTQIPRERVRRRSGGSEDYY